MTLASASGEPRVVDISGSQFGRTMLLGDSESVAHVVELPSLSELSSFPICVSYFCRRMCISSSGELCVTGHWGKRLVTAYDAGTGAVRWSLAGVQPGSIAFSSDDSSVYVFHGNTTIKCLELSATDGRKLSEEKGVYNRWGGEGRDCRFFDKKKCLSFYSRGLEASRLTAEELVRDVAFGGGVAAVCDVKGSMLFVDPNSGEVLARRFNPPGHNYDEVGYCAERSKFVAIRRCKSTATLQLVVFNDRYDEKVIADLRDFGWTRICNSSKHVIGSKGRVYDILGDCMVKDTEWSLKAFRG